MAIKDFIDSIKTKRFQVAVIGDCILDIYVYGKVSRISPEFPVPILHSATEDKEYCCGGSCNVASQFKHFNVDAYLIGAIDEHSQYVLSEKLDLSHCVTMTKGHIPKKIRFYDNDFPLLRHDVESSICEWDKDLILKKFFDIANKLDVVVLSNYSKGLFDKKLCQSIIDLCNKRNVPTIVDPKNNPDWWIGCTVFKPNASEAKAMTGELDWQKQCKKLKDMLHCDAVIITQSGSGVVGLSKDYFEYRPKYTIKDVSSVIGAGDAFTAILSLCVNKVSYEEAIGIAFEAGAEYVKAKHNRPILPYELYRRIDSLHAKIINIEDLLYLRNVVYNDQRWVWTNGVYDILHQGHLSTLQQAKHRGDKLIVGLNSDESVKRIKGESRPINGLSERMQLLAALECVDFVVSFEENTPYEIIRIIKPNVIVKGGDYKSSTVVGSDLVDEVFIAETIPGNSTTNIIEKIKNNL